MGVAEPLDHGEEYVVELEARLPIHGSGSERFPIEPSPGSPCVRAYGSLIPGSEGEPPHGIAVTAELRATSLTSAEDSGLALGRDVLLAAAVYLGTSFTEPRLRRTARTLGGFLVEQWDYLYEQDDPSTVEFDVSRLESMVSRVAAMAEPTRRRLTLASRWYARASGATDELDRFLSLWVGLEAVSPLLHARWHPEGFCRLCPTPIKNGKRRSRDPKIAGAEHVIRVSAPEVFDEISLETLRDLRGRITHAIDTDFDKLVRTVNRLNPDLTLALGRGILTAYDHKGSRGEDWSAVLPRDNRVQPSGRAQLQSPRPLPSYQPYLGEWIEFEKSEWMRSRWLDETGAPMAGEAPKIGYDVWLPTGMDEGDISRDFCWFERDGIVFHDASLELQMDSGLADVLPPRVEEWRPRTRTAAWQRAERGADEADQGGESPPLRRGRIR